MNSSPFRSQLSLHSTLPPSHSYFYFAQHFPTKAATMHLAGIFSITTVLALVATSSGAPQGTSDLHARELVAIVVSSSDNHQSCWPPICGISCTNGRGHCDDGDECVCDEHSADSDTHQTCVPKDCSRFCRDAGAGSGICNDDDQCFCGEGSADMILGTRFGKAGEWGKFLQHRSLNLTLMYSASSWPW